MRPKEATAATALQEGEPAVCQDVKSGGEPLIVDWKQEQRGNLEIAMKDGVAVVAYSCDGIKLLDSCKLEGQYGFVGMTRREQVVRLNSSDEVKANLPLSGATIGGEMARDSALDIALILVGKRRTTWAEPSTADLKGDCKGATHYVKGAMVGAFALETGTSAKVRVAAEIFAASAGTASGASRQVRQTEGNPSDCAKSSPDADKPPDQCGAPVRLVLSPIAATPTGDQAPPPPAAAVAEPAPCPEGLVFAEGKCTARTRVSAYECKPSDIADCKAQCDKGNAASCGWLGLSERRSDPTGAGMKLSKACEAGMGVACVAFGELVEQGGDKSKDPILAGKLYEQGCKAGEASGCERLGRIRLAAKDNAGAAKLFGQACDGGSAKACAEAAKLSPEGKAETVALWRRACEGGDSDACTTLGDLHESGAPGAPQNVLLAENFYRRACYRGSAEGCTQLGRLVYTKNPSEAQNAFKQACIRQNKIACAALNVLYGEKHVIVAPAMRQDLLMSCMKGGTKSCSLVGLLDAASNNPMGKANLSQACGRGDQFACAVQKKVK